MFELFEKYCKASGFQRSMSIQQQQNSGLTPDEWIFIYDHYDEIKKDYILFMSALKIVCRDYNLDDYKCAYRSSYFEELKKYL